MFGEPRFASKLYILFFIIFFSLWFFGFSGF
ncbi:hypothetical protein NC653_024445 [Populus alba x Populus x berolinensis]|uniref:Uncharacterized protein n=1 Tax=Populus alba x Populus x berolinensis TaxID=444605 RepID=A0AAD6M8T7_9ROSI|nr:hypothetical protein NC653_024445 [Populus alba x Populus x berolinensis]